MRLLMLFAVVLLTSSLQARVLDDEPSPEHTVQQQLHSIMFANQPGLLSDPTCTKGARPNSLFVSANDPSCNSKNSYLESGLNENLRLIQQSQAQHGVESLPYIERDCIKSSQNRFYSWVKAINEQRKKKGQKAFEFFGQCQPPSNTPTRSQEPPCLSEKYIEVTSRSLAIVSDCLGLDQKELIPLINLESGFFTNALSVIGDDTGIGQITPPAQAEAALYWETFLQHSQADSAPKSCAVLHSQPEIDRRPDPQDFNQCKLISSPPSPMKNILFLGLLIKAYQRYMDWHFANPDVQSRLEEAGLERLSEEESKSLKEILVFLAYNAGIANAYKFLDSYLDSKIKERQTYLEQAQTQQKRASELQLQMQKLKKEGQLDKARKLEASEKQARKLAADNMEQYRRSGLKKEDFNVEDSRPGGFSDFLSKNKLSGYLHSLIEKKKALDREVGPGYCSSENFLKM